MGIRHLIIAVIFALTLAPVLSANIEITCIYKPDQVPWAIITTPKFVTCELQTDLKSTDAITNVLSEQTTPTKGDVEIFVVEGKTIPQIPSGLKEIFPKLIGLKIDSEVFEYLDNDMLKPIAGLKYLAITNSKMDTIFADTFKDIALELIDFTGSQIWFISASVFAGPGSALKYLYLEVTCLFGGAESTEATNPTALSALLIQVEEKCGDTKNLESSLMKKTKSLLAASESSQDCEPCGNEEECPPEDCTDELNALNSTLIEAEDKLDVCNKEIDSLNATNLELNKKIEELEALTSNTGDGTCGFKTVANVYSCYAKISVKTAAEQTVNWNGTHASDKNNDAVLSMVIYSQTVEILPLNIGTVFKNLISLAVKNSGLTKIKAGDFKTLTKLETLEITGNNITTIDATAFSGLTKLVKLDLSANKITVLPSKVFDTLSTSVFKILDLSYNVVKVRYDIINAANTIKKAYFKNNTAMAKLDRTFVWRLQKADIIDLEGTGCDYSLDKTLENPVSFMSFYSDIVTFC